MSEAGWAAASPAAGTAPARRLHTPAEPELALAAVAEAAEDWGGSWERQGTGGRLRLPVQAGLRHGVLDVAVATAGAAGGGTEASFTEEAAAWRVHRPAAGLLFVALVGSLACVLWPFFPALVPLAPMGLVLGVGAWLVVLSRLRHQGLAELVEDVQGRLAELEEGEGAGEGDRGAPAEPAS